MFTHIFHLELFLSQQEIHFPKGINYAIHFFSVHGSQAVMKM